MAGRKDKNIVDYFPHYCMAGKTLFIIESKFGHLGYSIWFKTLELLGSNENHYIDLRNESDLLFIISKLKITEQEFTDIYNMLSKLEAIDSFLWSKKIIYSENFVKNIEDAYKRRSNKCMHKLDLCNHLNIKCTQKVSKSKQKTTEESRVEESKEDNIPSFEDFKKHALSKKPFINLELLKLKYDSWIENNWKDGNNKQIKNWKSKLTNVVGYIKEYDKNHRLQATNKVNLGKNNQSYDDLFKKDWDGR